MKNLPEQQFKPYIVGYIDIIGFSNRIRRRENLINLLCKVKQGLEEMKGNNAHLGFDYCFASDSIFISYPLPETEDGFADNFLSLCHNLTDFQLFMLLEEGLPVRGCLNVGDLYHKNDIILGPALIEAVDWEKDICFYPRILFHDRLLETFKKYWQGDFSRFMNQFLITQKEIDQHYSMDWLKFGIKLKNVRENPEQIFPPLRNQIERYFIECANVAKYRTKWAYLVEYFNSRLPEINEKFSLTLEPISLTSEAVSVAV